MVYFFTVLCTVSLKIHQSWLNALQIGRIQTSTSLTQEACIKLSRILEIEFIEINQNSLVVQHRLTGYSCNVLFPKSMKMNKMWLFVFLEMVTLEGGQTSYQASCTVPIL